MPSSNGAEEVGAEVKGVVTYNTVEGIFSHKVLLKKSCLESIASSFVPEGMMSDRRKVKANRTIHCFHVLTISF